jgi:phosphatidylserine/phosphatidylglycerophosphate/cardiolipin synthase-like enzyme
MQLRVAVIFLSTVLATHQARAADGNDCAAAIGISSDAHATPGAVEAAFGPDGEAEALILKVITKARCSIRLAAFAFSSPKIVDALAAAARQGIDVQLVVDHRHNVVEDHKGIGRSALASMVRAHALARTNGSYRLLHDKFIVVDGRHVQTGSYNYARSANSNSENVIVIWDDPALAARYIRHWRSRFDAGSDFAERKLD